MNLGSRLVRMVYDRRQWVTWAIPRGAVLPVRTPDFTVLVRPDDWAVGMRIAVKRTHESHVTARFREAVRPGSVVLDVGANIGWFTLLAARLTGESGRVHAFEPAARNVELLRRSLARNGFRNVEVHACAVSDREGVLGYSADDSNGHVQGDAGRAGLVPVRSVRLDDELRGIERLDVVKLDIEGSEALALAGMRELLRAHRPVAFVEFSPGALREVSRRDPGEVLADLRAAGLAIWRIERDGPLAGPLDDAAILASVAPDDPASHVDLLARPLPAA